MASINLPAGSFDPAAPETLWRSGNYDMSLALGNRLEEELLPLFQMVGWFKPRKRKILYRTCCCSKIDDAGRICLRLEVAMTDIPEMSTIELCAQRRRETALWCSRGLRLSSASEKVN
jgi:hypothetical protein